MAVRHVRLQSLLFIVTSYGSVAYERKKYRFVVNSRKNCPGTRPEHSRVLLQDTQCFCCARRNFNHKDTKHTKTSNWCLGVLVVKFFPSSKTITLTRGVASVR